MNERGKEKRKREGKNVGGGKVQPGKIGGEKKEERRRAGNSQGLQRREEESRSKVRTSC